MECNTFLKQNYKKTLGLLPWLVKGAWAFFVVFCSRVTCSLSVWLWSIVGRCRFSKIHTHTELSCVLWNYCNAVRPLRCNGCIQTWKLLLDRSKKGEYLWGAESWRDSSGTHLKTSNGWDQSVIPLSQFLTQCLTKKDSGQMISLSQTSHEQFKG